MVCDVAEAEEPSRDDDLVGNDLYHVVLALHVAVRHERSETSDPKRMRDCDGSQPKWHKKPQPQLHQDKAAPKEEQWCRKKPDYAHDAFHVCLGLGFFFGHQKGSHIALTTAQQATMISTKTTKPRAAPQTVSATSSTSQSKRRIIAAPIARAVSS